ncbi:hypothetical protein [Neobacillus sp. YIM B06451]|uniref:hypothetical protein n=1 Tax=Neobacillus sp. YIM B06451 TaxID=3070994 RepID=UPI00292DFF1A|nr:hypothetical protein [Neobacillus sp. YIM B06451]
MGKGNLMVKGQEYVVLAFFKEKKIDYIYYEQDKLIAFPCLNCQQKLNMCSITTFFSCACGYEGNLISLIKSSFPKDIRLYNPKKEKKEINKMLNKLSIKSLSDCNKKTIDKAIIKINNLIEYYEKNGSPNNK